MSDSKEPTVPCLFCEKEMESALAPHVGSCFQPYGGGEVFFDFCFGSTKFDNCQSVTRFKAFICDDCAAKHVPKMEEILP